MDLLILDKDLVSVMEFDTFESLLWVERYSEYGDFEIYTPIDIYALTFLQKGYYIWREDSEKVMIIESVQLTSDADTGNRMRITGRTLESILTRRIVWKQTTLSGNLQNGIKKLINDAIISPTDPARKIPNFVFKDSTDPAVTSLKVDAQFTGDNLYDAVRSICEEQGIGFKIVLTDDNKFEFSLYAGAVRDFSQETRPYVVFSHKFDNLTNSDYIESDESLKTIALVAGEGEGEERKTLTVNPYSPDPTNLERRELYIDARDISSQTSEGDLTNEEYMALLKTRGLKYLLENTSTRAFSGGVDTNSMFKYGIDYFIGDIVQIENEYGIKASVRITEIIRSESTAEVTLYPTFEVI